MTLLRLARADEARTILEAEDAFTRALGSFDLSFRLRTTQPVTNTELRRFFGEQARDFSAEETDVWESAMDAVAGGAQGLGALLPSEVLVVKTTGKEERGHAYTRANAIVLPAARVERLRGERAIYLLAHELFHVASRASPGLRDATYARLGFSPIAPITPPIELDARRMTNPDAHRLGHYLRLGERDVVPLLTCPKPLAEAIGSPTALDAVEVSLLEIDANAGTVVRDANGAPVLIAASKTDWARRLGRNTKYTIHPEEVLADNHALLVRRRLGSGAPVSDPAFLEAFEEAIHAARRSPDVELRDVVSADLPVLFRHQADPEANRMAVVNPRDESAFRAHWAKIFADPKVVAKAIVVDGRLAGSINVFDAGGQDSVGYWLGREYWGRGIATRALRLLLDQVETRPLHAHVATSNVASRRVLEHCGFVVTGFESSPATDRFPACEEAVLVLT